MGTERMRTNAAGNVAAGYLSLPFEDGFAASGLDEDPDHFAFTERDAETYIDRATFRQYEESPAAG